MTKVIFILLATSLVALQTPTCEASLDPIKDFLTIKNFIQVGIDLIKWAAGGTEEVEDNTAELVEKLSSNVDEMRNELKGNFTDMITRVEKIPNIVLESNIKESFQNLVDRHGDGFKALAEKQIKTNKKLNWLGASEASVVGVYEKDLQTDWLSLQHYLIDKNIINYLKRKEANDVCETHISHAQLLEKTLGEYLVLGSQYLFSQHIIYNIREQLDKHSKNDDRQFFNNGLQKTLETGVNKFKAAMTGLSTEFWLCDPDQSTTMENPEMDHEDKKVSFDECTAIQQNGYQCIPGNGVCDCSKSTIAISLAMARAEEGHVIVGAQMKFSGKVLYIAAEQAKLLPSGQIDLKTIRPVTKGTGGGYVDFVLKKNLMELSSLVVPSDRYITAVGFQKRKNGIVYIGAQSTMYDSNRKQLVPGSVRPEEPSQDNKIKDIQLFRKTETVEKGGKKTHKWTESLRPAVDTRMVESSMPSPISGVGLFLRGTEQDGYLAIKVNTYDQVRMIPKISSLNQFPVQEALKGLSDSASLRALEQKLKS